ncbi:MAG: hypothetical protein GWM87_08505, partial [Xanthomonadales bacterium]|nr:hypothetical protein [Xanthomonadales bacterium]NIX12964.1 hypothetical protein [Xanthomonadales bacterium]
DGLEAVDDGIMWLTHGDGTRLGIIDTSDATDVDIGAQGVSQSWAAAFDTNGDLYGTYNGFSGNAQLAIFDQGTGGIAATIGGLGTSLIALEVDAGGQMWGVGYFDSVLYQIDKSNALATPVGPTGITSTMDLAFAPDGTLYSTVGNVLYELDTGTGAVNDSMPINGILDGSVMGIAFDTNGRLFATAYVSDSPLYEIDPGTGNAGVVGPTTFFAPHGGDIYFDVGLPDLNVDSNTRPSPGKGHEGPVFAPTSCGPLYLNEGAFALEKDEEGNLVLVDGEPVVVAGPTAPLCLAAVRQDLLDLLPEYDSDADHDGDTLSSHFEACEGVTDPCLADTDGDGVHDDVDACPL